MYVMRFWWESSECSPYRVFPEADSSHTRANTAAASALGRVKCVPLHCEDAMWRRPRRKGFIEMALVEMGRKSDVFVSLR